MDYQKIGIFIATKRKEIGLTQKELAHKLNITDKAVSKWERGLGCPDVSILEKLSKILGVSILDILNGEDVVEEFIDTNNVKLNIASVVDDAKKQNDKLKSIVSKFLIGIILSVGFLIIILNVLNIKRLNKKSSFHESCDTTYFEEILTTVDKLNNNMKVIKNNQGIYTNEEYNVILESLDEIEESINNSKLLEYYKNKSYLKEFDLYMLSYEGLSPSPIALLNNILINYDDSFNDFFTMYAYMYVTTGMLLSDVYEPIYLAYYDINSNVPEIDNIRYGFKEDAILSNYLYALNVCNYLVNSIIEVGEINV